jgi:hypothetical protein
VSDAVPSDRPAGSRWSTRRWLVVGLVVVVLAVWFAIRYALASEREQQFFSTVVASTGKAFDELERQSALPAADRSREQLETVAGIELRDIHGAELMKVGFPAASLAGDTQYALLVARSTTSDLNWSFGVEGRYVELLLRGTYTGAEPDESMCVVRIYQPGYPRSTTEEFAYGDDFEAPPCTDADLAAAGGIAS